MYSQKLFMTLIQETPTLKPKSHVKNNSETSINFLGSLVLRFFASMHHHSNLKTCMYNDSNPFLDISETSLRVAILGMLEVWD